MSAFPSTGIITENGVYDLANLFPGFSYQISFASADWGSAAIVVSFDQGPAGEFLPIDAPNFGESRLDEVIVARSRTIRFTVTNIADPIRINVLPAKGQGSIGDAAGKVIEATVGDSLMHEDAVDISTHGFWLNELGKAERYSGATRVDLAANGKTLAQVDADILTSLSQYANPPVGTKLIVFVGTGINDLSAGTSAAATHTIMMSIFSKIKSIGGYPVVFGSPFRAAYSAAVDSYNTLLRAEVADGTIEAFVDLERLDYSTYDNDVHPDQAGNTTIANEVRSVLGGSPIAPPSSLSLGVKTAIAITNISAAAAAVVTSGEPHGLSTGDHFHASGTNSTPVIDGVRKVTVLSSTTFSVPVTTSVAGTTGAINKGLVRLAGGVKYNRQHTWLLQTFNDNANGGNVEVFLATNMFSAGDAIELKLQSIAFKSSGFGEASPIFETGYTYSNPTVDLFIINKSASFSFIIYPALLANSRP